MSGEVGFLQVEPTTRCNFHCVFCAGRHLPQRDMDLDLFEAALRLFPRIEHLELQGEGEPLLHPRFFDMVRLAKHLHPGVRVSTITNGSLLSGENIDRILDVGLHKLHISLESADPAVFQEIRGGRLETVVEGARALMAARRQRESEWPVVGFAVTQLRRTRDEVPRLVSLYASLGLDGGFAFQPLQTMAAYTRYYSGETLAQRLSPGDAEEIRRVLAEDPGVVDVLRHPAAAGFWDELFGGWESGSGTCAWLARGMYISVDGCATSCCFQKDPALNSYGMIGQATAGQLLEKRRELEEMLGRGEPPAGCRDCAIARDAAGRAAGALRTARGLEEGRSGGVSAPQSILLGIGTGRCGLRRLAGILNQQPGTQCSYEEPPLLEWRRTGDRGQGTGEGEGGEGVKGETPRVIRERFARFRRNAKKEKERLGDCASFYLPYIEEAIALEPTIRVVCLRRLREEVVKGFCEWLDENMPLPTNHWARRPEAGWHHDPNRTRIYPQYDTPGREEGIRRYWDEYYQRAEELARRYPQHVRVFDSAEVLNTEAGLREVLSFAGIVTERQVVAEQGAGSKERGALTPGPSPERRGEQAQALTPGPSPATNLRSVPGGETKRPGRWARRATSDPMDPRRCVVLVPFATAITPPCERSLVELERRGYEVRRVGGYAAIDQGRNQMATDALLDGFEETFWIDADVEFHPDAVQRLRSHRLPAVCGIYPQKGKRAVACHIAPGTPKTVFGKGGGVVEILYAGAGFLLVRREVYLAIQEQLQLPMCNERFGVPLLPFFHPMLHACEDGHWYLAEDYAFCERARACGFRIMADTTVRLWHIGTYAFGWEDAGMDRKRFDSFTLNYGPGDGKDAAKARELPSAGDGERAVQDPTTAAR